MFSLLLFHETTFYLFIFAFTSFFLTVLNGLLDKNCTNITYISHDSEAGEYYTFSKMDGENTNNVVELGAF